MSKMKSYLSDAALLMDREFGYHDNVPENYKEYRYEERYGDYLLRCWCDGREVSTKGEIETRPMWLSEIIDLAKVGGHMARVNQPPPDCIVWFETDANNRLQQFKDMERK